jgi:hypothetical protein
MYLQLNDYLAIVSSDCDNQNLRKNHPILYYRLDLSKQLQSVANLS